MQTSAIAPEFIRQARTFRGCIVAADARVSAAMDRTALLISAQVARGSVSTRAMAMTASAWKRNVPATGRLALEIKHVRHSLRIEEYRLCGATFRFEEWDADVTEAGLALALTTFAVDARTFQFTRTPIASISLHAIARRFERGWGATDAAVLDDLAGLALDHEAQPDADGSFAVSVPSGQWIGEAVEIEHHGKAHVIAAVRTFLPGDMVANVSRVAAPAEAWRAEMAGDHAA